MIMRRMDLIKSSDKSKRGGMRLQLASLLPRGTLVTGTIMKLPKWGHIKEGDRVNNDDWAGWDDHKDDGYGDSYHSAPRKTAVSHNEKSDATWNGKIVGTLSMRARVSI
ncbi:hypothetical protein SAY86_014969 [Trapa natans]|uniref:Uncharacterized protein n=1 Tax=Trapa natans TaxID=22666 RepID=A0AAN7KL57_TRANT|nr:hypothetical protein SAY86_014969 [Trapa natans]